ncbi:MAG: septal ring lytic transglycosylase RlpA family protein [Pseudomonadota bacterium]
MKHSLFFLLLLIFFFTGCAEKKLPEPTPPPQKTTTRTIPPTQRPYRVMGKTYYPLPSFEGYEETGIASWYGPKFHGRKTSNGETYDMHGVSAAHKTLPMNTMVLVENLENDREIVLRINDRGPFVKGRIIDLSFNAAKELSMTGKGTARVRVTALGEAKKFTEGNRTVERFLPHQDFQRGDFFVQLGSFADRNNADGLHEKMSRRGEQARILTFDRGDMLFYRVQVFAGNTLSAARQREQTFNTSGFPDAFVVAQ